MINFFRLRLGAILMFSGLKALPDGPLKNELFMLMHIWSTGVAGQLERKFTRELEEMSEEEFRERFKGDNVLH